MQSNLSKLLTSKTKEIEELKTTQNSFVTKISNINPSYLIKKDSGEYLQVISLQEEVTLSGDYNYTNILIPHHSIVLSVNVLVLEQIKGSDHFSVGVSDKRDTYGNNLSCAKGTTNIGLSTILSPCWKDMRVFIYPTQGKFTSGKMLVNIQALKPHGPWKWE